MKKLYFTLIAMLFATATYAQELSANDRTFSNAEQLFTLTGNRPNCHSMRTTLKFGKSTCTATATAKQRATAANNTPTLITKQPKGTLYKDLYGFARGFYVFYGTAYYDLTDGVTKDVVIDNDNNFYIKDPISNVSFNTWIKGHKAQGDTIEVQLPQAINKVTDEDTGESAYMYLYKMVLDQQNSTYVPDKSSQIMKFVWRNDSLIKVDDDLLGLALEDGSWQGYGDDVITMNVMKLKPEAPQNPNAAENYQMHYDISIDKDDRVVKVAIEGNNFYLGNLSKECPSNWAKGHIEGNKVIFDAYSYMGIDSTNRAHTFLVPAGYKDIYYEYINQHQDSIFFRDKVIFDYDAANKTLTTDSGFVVNRGIDDIKVIAKYFSPTLKPWTETVGAPLDPVFTAFEPYDKKYGYGSFSYQLSKYDSEGHLLNPDKLYYNVYFDDEKITFYPDEYKMIPNDMTDVPYSYIDSWDFYMNGITRKLYFYCTGLEKVGLQSFYLDGDKKYASKLVFFDANATGIHPSATVNSPVKSISYTDLSGRKVKRPAKGIYIKTTVYANGTVQSAKFIAQ